MPAAYFDEIVDLAVVGGGFLRVPHLHATVALQDLQRGAQPLQPQIVHLPAAHRRSGLSLQDPPFRRVVITSTMSSIVTQDQAAQANQENAGVACRFHADPHRSVARAILDAGTTFAGDAALILDSHPNQASMVRPSDHNLLGDTDPTLMPTGYLVFINRSWADQRHLDPSLQRHIIPLHYDVDLDVVYLGGLGDDSSFNIPVWGSTGHVKAWDSRLGPGSQSDLGSPIKGATSRSDTSGGTISVLIDANGLPYLQVTLSGTVDLSSLPITIQDTSDQVYQRSLVVLNSYPTPPDAALPSARMGTPYASTLPQESNFLHYVSDNLPLGLVRTGNVITGIPTTYGGNFSVTAEVIDIDGDVNTLTFWLASNRTPRCLLSIYDDEGNDHHTGEYYAVQYMPYGTCLAYGGEVFEFRRSKSSIEHWPAVRDVRYVLGHSSREAGIDAEAVWAASGAVPASP